VQLVPVSSSIATVTSDRANDVKASQLVVAPVEAVPIIPARMNAWLWKKYRLDAETGSKIVKATRRFGRGWPCGENGVATPGAA